MNTDPNFCADMGETGRGSDAPILIVYPVWETFSAALPVAAHNRTAEGHCGLWIGSWLSLIVAFAIYAAGDAYGPTIFGIIAAAGIAALRSKTL